MLIYWRFLTYTEACSNDTPKRLSQFLSLDLSSKSLVFYMPFLGHLHRHESAIFQFFVSIFDGLVLGISWEVRGIVYTDPY